MADVEKLISLAKAKSCLVTTAESCTGGLVASQITSISGSSDVFDRGYVTYSNHSKCEILNVELESISRYGAVSHEVVRAMSSGAVLQASLSDHAISIAISGIAGPDGGSESKPVGTVYFGLSHRHLGKVSTDSEYKIFEGDRSKIRLRAVEHSIKMIVKFLEDI